MPTRWSCLGILLGASVQVAEPWSKPSSRKYSLCWCWQKGTIWWNLHMKCTDYFYLNINPGISLLFHSFVVSSESCWILRCDIKLYALSGLKVPVVSGYLYTPPAACKPHMVSFPSIFRCIRTKTRTVLGSVLKCPWMQPAGLLWNSSSSRFAAGSEECCSS